MKVIFATWFGTVTACLVFLFGVDHLARKHETPIQLIDAPGYAKACQENRDLRWDRFKLELVIATRDEELANAITVAQKATARAREAEAKLACVEQEVITLRALADAARRDAVRIPLVEDQEPERIPAPFPPIPIPSPPKE